MINLNAKLLQLINCFIGQFLKGKMYNRCKRGHTLLSVAVHGRRHLERFIDDLNIKNDLVSELDKIATEGPVDADNLSQMIKHIIATV